MHSFIAAELPCSHVRPKQYSFMQIMQTQRQFFLLMPDKIFREGVCSMPDA